MQGSARKDSGLRARRHGGPGLSSVGTGHDGTGGSGLGSLRRKAGFRARVSEHDAGH